MRVIFSMETPDGNACTYDCTLDFVPQEGMLIVVGGYQMCEVAKSHFNLSEGLWRVNLRLRRHNNFSLEMAKELEDEGWRFSRSIDGGKP